MDFEALHVFVEICRNRSMRKAAESLRLSQPTLTKKVQKLEHFFGAQLLNRLPRGVEPTAYGAIVERHAKFVLGEVTNAREIIRGVRTGILGTVRIGMSIATAHTIMPAVVKRVHARYPNVEICLVERTVEKLSMDLVAGDLDLVVAPLPRSGADRDLEVRPLVQDELVVVGSDQHPAVSKGALLLGDLLEYPWAFIGEDPHKESLIMPILLRKGLPSPKWVVQTNSIGLFVNLIRSSDCLALMSRRMTSQHERHGIRPINVFELSIPWPVMVSYRRNSIVTPLMKTVIEELDREK